MSIKIEAYYIPSTEKEERLHVLTWECEQPKGVVQLIHGMCEHIGRYDEFARKLCGSGYNVIGHSHLGHGLTARAPEDLGFFAKKDGWEHVVRDVGVVRRFAEKRWPGLPYMMFGHSMGSFVLRDYLSRSESAGVKAAVICGTGDTLIFAGAAAKTLASESKRSRGERYRSRRLTNIIFGSYNNRIKPKRTEFDWLSKNEQSVDKYISDPLCGFMFTSSAYRDLAQGLENVYIFTNIQKIHKYNPELRCFIITGKLDPVGEYSRGARRVYRKFALARINTTVKVYPDDRHELLNELDRETVMGDVLEFFDNSISAASGASEEG